MVDDDHLKQIQDDLKSARDEYNEDYNPKPKNNKSLDDGARAGVELVGAILGGALIGYGLDYVFETTPIIFIIFIFLGTITGFYNIYKITMGTGTSVGFGGLQNKSKNAKQKSNFKDG
ncbi:MAG: AtpZ/AtpI family protein [Pseudomonadota bacterium]